MKANLLPFSFPVSAIFVSNGATELHSKYFDSLNEAIDNGFTPILYGDISFDIKSKFRVISGDRIIRDLVEYLHTLKTNNNERKFDSIKVIFGSNVDGLYDKDPKHKDAKLIENITNSEISKLIDIAGESEGTDVTGGMKGKLTEIKQISDLGVEVQIVNLMKNNRIYNALINQNDVRTIITKSD
jgi:isopentenyl phosphate kinase